MNKPQFAFGDSTPGSDTQFALHLREPHFIAQVEPTALMNLTIAHATPDLTLPTLRKLALEYADYNTDYLYDPEHLNILQIPAIQPPEWLLLDTSTDETFIYNSHSKSIIHASDEGALTMHHTESNSPRRIASVLKEASRFHRTYLQQLE